jgi:Na+-translocating ferredoxin:NAD+ oxidoreductase RNF subunit RnfB
VHSAFNVQKGAIGICNCCGCCCAILRGITQLEIPSAIAKSNFVVEIEEENCVGCGECVERCQVKALDLDDSVVVLLEERCIGCGVGVSSCPSEAIVMKRRKEGIVPPETVNELMARIAEDRAK